MFRGRIVLKDGKFLTLPLEVERMILCFDPTYSLYFTEKVLPELMEQVWKRHILKYFLMCWNQDPDDPQLEEMDPGDVEVLTYAVFYIEDSDEEDGGGYVFLYPEDQDDDEDEED